MKTLLIAGNNNSGKSVITNWLSEKNYLIIECGDLVKRLMKLQKFVGDSCDFNERMKKDIGNSFLYKFVLKEISSSKNKSPNAIIICGIRTKELYQKLQSTLPYTTTIFIDSNQKIRFKRQLSISKKNNEIPISFAKFKERDFKHNSWGLKYIKRDADFIINNNSTINNFIKSFEYDVLNFFSLPTNQNIQKNVTIGNNCRFFGSILISNGVIIEDNVSIGNSAFFKVGDNPVSCIGENSIIRSGSVIYENVSIGRNVDCAHNVTVRENTEIGDNCYLTPNTLIKSFVKVGKNCRLGGLIADRTIIKNSVTSLGYLLHKFEPRSGGHIEQAPKIENNVIIGRNSIILGDVSICENSIVGAGAVITKNIRKKGIYYNQVTIKRKLNE